MDWGGLLQYGVPRTKTIFAYDPKHPDELASSNEEAWSDSDMGHPYEWLSSNQNDR